jgi:hypothetical protein
MRQQECTDAGIRPVLSRLRQLAGLRYPTVLAAVVMILGGVALALPRPASAETWCGTESAVDRPDTTGGNLIHVLYAFPADGPNRFQERAAAIATDLSLVAQWWRSQDASREPRFDFAAIPGCGSRFGQLDITVARTTDTAAAYASLDGRFERLIANLAPALTDMQKKYVIFFDSPADLQGEACGVAQPLPTSGGQLGVAAVWLAPNLFGIPGCGILGDGGYVATTAVHEIIHSLGALDFFAATPPPHACPGDPGHPCDSPRDVLAPAGESNSLNDYVLDVGRDDYYGHSAPWWDVQDSSWLAHLNAGLRRVSVTIVGGGPGSRVSGTTPGIACPAVCALDFDGDMPIELVTVPGEGLVFAGWSGDCSGSFCAVPLNRSASLTARFVPLRYRITVVVRGRGSVTTRPRGLVACPRRCRGSFAYGRTVRLVAKPAAGYRFAGWRGDCNGRRPCLADGDLSVTAVFRR